MKKFLTLLLALSLVACMSLSVSAATITDFSTGNPTSVSTVSINLKESTAGDAGIVYMVDVTWAGTNLEYTIQNGNEAMVWDPVNHVYKLNDQAEEVQGSWGESKVTATVVNHSNTAIEATLTGLAETNGVSFTANQDDVTLPSAAEGESLGKPSAAPSFAFVITPTNTPTKDFTINFTITLRNAG